ncbi:hypothetical protein [Halobacteriovorax sp. RT-2-6]|uniref:hypothetical protein n=1 Tax=unclassified Halobacteriovorax TaxID=2639665 RepID=UPI00399C3F9B
MKQQSLKFTIIVGCFWILIMGIINLVFKPYGIDYDSGWAATSAFFIASALIFNYLTNSIQISKDHVKSYLLVIIVFLAMALSINYIFPISIIKKFEIINSKIIFPLFSWNVFVSKSADIIFQQLLINILIEHYLKFYNRRDSVKYFGIFFAVIHLPLFYVFGLKALYFILPSIAGGVLFAYLISYFYRGYLLSLGFHFTFYLGLGVFLRYLN